MKTIETTQTDKAVLLGNLPCNPIPFLNRLHELAKECTDNNQTDQYKANLLLLVMQSYPLQFSLDFYDELQRLKPALNQ